jgi:lysophospholipase L1-like esterase
MNDKNILRHSAALSCAVALLLAAPTPARPQSSGPVAPAPVALQSPSPPAAPRAPACVVSLDQARFVQPLARTARLLASGKPIKIVALGSSSTYGAGATSSAGAYPNRLAEELSRLFPGHEITVLNRGVGGDEASDMLKRLDADVIAEKPDLILWQVGTNSVLHDKAVLPHASLLHEGLTRLKAIGADIVLIDPQYAPKVIAKPNHEGMVSLIATAAKAEHVCLFHRFELMRRWYEAERMSFESFLSPDGLHMNDWSYGCLAKWLAAAIAEAATRPVATATGPQTRR